MRLVSEQGYRYMHCLQVQQEILEKRQKEKTKALEAVKKFRKGFSYLSVSHTCFCR